MSNRTDELVFSKLDDNQRGVVQGKAQALWAIINLPNELQDLKSMEDLQKAKLDELKEEE